MENWQYRARTIQGEIKEGVLQAESRDDATRSLVRKRLIPEWVKPAPKPRSASSSSSSFFGPAKVKPQALAVFARQFATLINAAVPLVHSLEILEDLTEDRSLAKAIHQVAIDVQSGSSLAAAMKLQPHAFGDMFVNMVSAGEQGGLLDIILSRLADYLERSTALVGKVKTAMLYPSIILFVALGSALVMLTFVVPTFEDMFASSDMELPYPTQLLIAASAYVQAKWQWLLGGAVGGFFAISRGYKTDAGRYLGDSILLHVPVLGDLIRKTAVARFSQSMASLLKSGSNLIDSLISSSATAGNMVIQKALLRTRPAIEAGQGISKPLAASGVIPNLVARMVEVGEETGNLDDMFEKVAIFYEGEVDVAVDRLMKAMEPALIVVVGVILGGMVVALYLPIFDALSTVEV